MRVLRTALALSLCGSMTGIAQGRGAFEHIDFSDDPSKVGTSFTATCRVDGGRWYSSFTVPNDTTKGPYRRWIQVYRRVE